MPGTSTTQRGLTQPLGPKMRVRRSTWFLIATCFLSWCAFTTRPNPWVQLAAMASVIVALIWLAKLAIQGSLKWRERGARNLISCLLIIASFPLAVFCGQTTRSAIFSHNLDRWNQAVTWVTTHKEPNRDNLIELPSRYADLAYGVHYKHDKACGLMIDFFWGGGFPVKHTVRRYAVNPNWIDIKQCRTDWSRGRMISGNWYEISD
jgi:hypothetical protein